MVTNRAAKEKINSLQEKGARVIVTPSKEGRVDLNFLMKELGQRNIDSILLEGGSELNYSALEEGIVDKVNAFIAPKIIGGNTAKPPVGGQGKAYMNEAINLERIDVHGFGQDIMIEGYIIKGG